PRGGRRLVGEGGGAVSAVTEIPTIVWGRRWDVGESASISLQGDATVRVGRFDTTLAARLLAADRTALAAVPTQEIVAFVNRAGRNWRNEGYFRRRLYMSQLRSLLGYSEKAAEAEADRIAALLTAHERAHDLLEAELGSRFVGDEWVRREDSW